MVLAVIETGVARVHGLPATRRGVGEGRAGELGSSRAPQVEEIRAGVAGAAVELERRDVACRAGLELHADFKRRAVIQVGLRRRIGRVKRLNVVGGSGRNDVEGLAGGEAADIGGRDLDAESADICSRRRAAERACRGVESEPGGQRASRRRRLPCR